jgi:glutathione S-transferase
MRARAAIYFSKTKVELREVLLRNKPSEMLDISAKGTVPVLKLEEIILDESIDIMLWALNVRDSEDLLCPYREQKNFVLDIIEKFDQEFKYHLDRYKYSSRYLNEKDFLSKEEHRNKGIKCLKTLQNILEKNNAKYLYKNKISIIDLALFPLVRQYKIADISFFNQNIDVKLVNIWLENLINAIFFKNIMYKYHVWHSGDNPVYFENNL